MWVRTGKQVEFTAWCSGQPDNQGPIGENCLSLWHNTCELKWNDIDCLNDCLNGDCSNDNIKPICQK